MSTLEMEETEGIALSNQSHDSSRVVRPNLPRIEIKQGEVAKGLGKLVLTLVELIRELLERQAIRRIESGTLGESEVEKLGATFMQLAEQIEVLRKEFGLEDEDLNLDLGPIGKLL